MSRVYDLLIAALLLVGACTPKAPVAAAPVAAGSPTAMPHAGPGADAGVTVATAEPDADDEAEAGMLSGAPGDAGHGTREANLPAPPKIGSAWALEPQRTAGNSQIALPDAAVERLVAAGRTKVKVVVKVCVDTEGVPSRITFRRDSGDAAADATIRAGIEAWRYRPYLVNGKPEPVCFIVIFTYLLGP